MQLLLAGMVPPVRMSEFPFAAAVAVPPQLLVMPGVAELTRPEGYVSVKATPVTAVVALLLTSSLSGLTVRCRADDLAARSFWLRWRRQVTTVIVPIARRCPSVGGGEGAGALVLDIGGGAGDVDRNRAAAAGGIVPAEARDVPPAGRDGPPMQLVLRRCRRID